MGEDPPPPRELHRITHELRNIAGTLRGVMDIVTLRLGDGDPKLVQVSAAARRQLDRLAAAIEELDVLSATQRVEQTLAPPRPASTSGPHRIVVVEDDTAYGRLVATVLEERGHKVELATSGEEALSLIPNARPEVVLVDLGLPGIDGLEVARRLRALGSSMRLVALTGDARVETRDQAVAAGFDDFVVKGGDLQALESALVPIT